MFCGTPVEEHCARSIKEQNAVLLSNDGANLGRWREYFKDLVNPVNITPPNTQEEHSKKCTALKFAKPWLSSHFSSVREILTTFFRSCVLNVPQNIGEASPADHTHEKAAQQSSKNQVAWLISDLAWPRLSVEPAKLSKIALIVRYFESSYDCFPASLPRAKAGGKMNEFGDWGFAIKNKCAQESA